MSTFLDIDLDLSVEQALSKVRVELYRYRPFYGYLIDKMVFKESKKGELPYDTMGVDKWSRCWWTRGFVEKLKDKLFGQLVGTSVHELMHLALRHIDRASGKTLMVNGMSLWNICTDIQINYRLLQENFELPADSILPKGDEIEILGTVVKDLENKSAEDIYAELKAHCMDLVKQGKAKMTASAAEGEGESGGAGDNVDMPSTSLPKGTGSHKMWSKKDGGKEEKGEGAGKDGKEGKGISAGDKGDKGEAIPEGEPINWERAMAEGLEFARQRGNVPAGMARMYDELHTHELNWRTIIRRAVAGKIPYDYTYNRPNKKYLACFPDLYMPSMYGEKVKVITTIDTSGSISQKDLADFLSEIIGISKSFGQAEFIILTHDVDVHQCITINTGTISEIEAIVPEGGGGTSHIPVFDYIEENRLARDTKFVICFTDGDTEFPEDEPRCDILWVLAGHHCDPKNIPFGDVVTLD